MSSLIVCGFQINIKISAELGEALLFDIVLTPSREFGELELKEYRYHNRIANYLARFSGIDHKVLKKVIYLILN